MSDALPSEQDLQSAITALRERILADRSRAPEPAKLRSVWAAYHACSDELTREERIFALRSDPDAEPRGDERIDEAARNLAARGLALPFEVSADEFFPEIECVRTWASLTHQIASTQELHSGLICWQMSFSGADLHTHSRTGAARVAKELAITHPGLLAERSPTLEQIDILRSRHRAYTEARADAIAQLDQVLVRPFAHHQIDPLLVRYARLDALGLLSDQGARDFFSSWFLKLCCAPNRNTPRPNEKSRQNRRAFFEITARRPKWGNLRLLPLKLWLVDNRPVFICQGFHWTWSEILGEAKRLEIPVPASERGLIQLASSCRMGIALKRGERPRHATESLPSERLRSLLSSCPVFAKAVL